MPDMPENMSEQEQRIWDAAFGAAYVIDRNTSLVAAYDAIARGWHSEDPMAAYERVRLNTDGERAWQWANDAVLQHRERAHALMMARMRDG